MKAIEIDPNYILVDSKLISVSPAQITNYLDVGDFFLVLLEYSEDHTDEFENIWCFTKDGELQWKIQPWKDLAGEMEPYVRIRCLNGELIAHPYVGPLQRVDLKTGHIEDWIDPETGQPSNDFRR